MTVTIAAELVLPLWVPSPPNAAVMEPEPAPVPVKVTEHPVTLDMVERMQV